VLNNEQSVQVPRNNRDETSDTRGDDSSNTAKFKNNQCTFLPCTQYNK